MQDGEQLVEDVKKEKLCKQKQDWLEELVKKYSIPTEEKTDKRGILNESQLNNLKNGKN